MPGTSSFGLHAIVAGGIFPVLVALFFTFPPIMAGDMEAFTELLRLGGAMSFMLLAGALVILLPILVLFGTFASILRARR